MQTPLAPPAQGRSFANPGPDLAEFAMLRASAMGRRDGLRGEHGAGMPGATIDRLVASDHQQAWLPQDIAQSPVLLAALQQCYAAGHAHGADVRRENDARRQRAEPPVHSPHWAAGD